MQLSKGFHEVMVLPEDIVLPLKNRLTLDELTHQLSDNVDLQEKLVIWHEHEIEQETQRS